MAHYTAVIKISQSHTTGPNRPSNTLSPRPPEERKVTEIANIVIRADSIDSLITKATAHLNLVEDFEDGNN